MHEPTLICPNCTRDATQIHMTPKIAFSLVVEAWGLVSLVLLFLSIPIEFRRIQEPIGFESWLYPILEIPAIRAVVLIGAVFGFVIFFWDGIQAIRARKYQYSCKTCGHYWNV